MDVICDFAELDNLHCVSMSLDDFYLTGSDQDQLSGKFDGNSLLKFRGNGECDVNMSI